MPNQSATAAAHPNIAFIKYWGNIDNELRIPVSGSISMNLEGLETRTTVSFDEQLKSDQLTINDNPIDGEGLERVKKLLDRVREKSRIGYANVTSSNNFPSSSGIASSASAFAALTLAACQAAGLDGDLSSLSRMARTGSGSASRSIPEGFVEWHAGNSHENSFSESIASKDHWQLVDCIAIVSEDKKKVGSTSGHSAAPSSPLQNARIEDAERRLNICREALIDKDFDKFADIVELDSNLMHAVMQTSSPRILYWLPATVDVMGKVKQWRDENIDVCYTIDAGPNVHVLCQSDFSSLVKKRLKEIPGIRRVITAAPGGGARIISDE